MKNIKFTFNKSDILDSVSLHSAYTGAKDDKDEGAYERMATIEEDSSLLSDFWNEWCGKIAETFRSFITASVITAASCSFDLEVSNAYDESFTDSVRNDLFSAISHGVTSRWFGITCPERSKELEDLACCFLKCALSKLCYRKKPIRKR